MGGVTCISIWAEFEAVIREVRRRYTGSDFLSYFEYLAGEMNKMQLKKAPSYVQRGSKYVPDN
jgi:hypothetical protein